MIQVQMSVPALRTSASLITSLRRNEAVFMDIETDVSLHESSYKHKASLKYGNCPPSVTSSTQNTNRTSAAFPSTDDDKIEVEIKSDLNSEIQKLIPRLRDHQRQLQQLIDRTLDQKVAKTDMKLRHIVTKGIEVKL